MASITRHPFFTVLAHLPLHLRPHRQRRSQVGVLKGDKTWTFDHRFLDVRPAPPENVRFSNNLVAFICLIIQLHGIGYPEHWLESFLRGALANNLIATRNVWDSVLPRPV